MNIALILANILTLLAFGLHTIQGDRELHIIEPDSEMQKQEKWTMARCAWHWLSVDLFFATIGLGLVNFTDWIVQEFFFLQILFIYFGAYSVVWLLIIWVSKPFESRFIKLGQWILLLIISLLIGWGIGWQIGVL